MPLSSCMFVTVQHFLSSQLNSCGTDHKTVIPVTQILIQLHSAPDKFALKVQIFEDAVLNIASLPFFHLNAYLPNNGMEVQLAIISLTCLLN